MKTAKTTISSFLSLFAHKTLHANVQREQDNKAQITGTNSCKSWISEIVYVFVSDMKLKELSEHPPCS